MIAMVLVSSIVTVLGLFWAFSNIKAQTTENIVDSPNSATHGVNAPCPRLSARERYIDPPTRQHRVLF